MTNLETCLPAQFELPSMLEKMIEFIIKKNYNAKNSYNHRLLIWGIKLKLRSRTVNQFTKLQADPEAVG